MGDFPDEDRPSNDNEERQFLAEVEEAQSQLEAEGVPLPRTQRGSRIRGGWDEPWQLAPDGVTEGTVSLGHSVEGFHYNIELRDARSFDVLDVYGQFEIRNGNGTVKWSPPYPTLDAARQEGYAALNRVMCEPQEPAPLWPSARDKEPVSDDHSRNPDSEIDR